MLNKAVETSMKSKPMGIDFKISMKLILYILYQTLKVKLQTTYRAQIFFCVDDLHIIKPPQH